MAMAKQQQYHSEKQLNYKLQLAQNNKRRFVPSTLANQGGVGAGGSFALSAHSQSASGVGGGEGSQQLQNAGAMVLHQNQSGRAPPPQQHSRKLL